MKKSGIIILIFLMLLLVCSGCSSVSENNLSYIKEYIYDSVDYELDDLRVVEEENGIITIVATFDKNTSLEDFVPRTKDIISISNEAAENKNTSINRVNTIIYLQDISYCEYIGWSSENGTLYTENYREDKVENVDIDNVNAEIEKLLAKKEHTYKLLQSHLNINQIISSTKAKIISDTDLETSYVDIFENKDYSLTINVGISGKEKNDTIIEQFGMFVEQVMVAINKSVIENETVIKMVTVGISDNNDMPIVNWITGNSEVGLLTDYRSDKTSYDNIAITNIQSYLD